MAKRNPLFYGPSGSAKSENAKRIIENMHRDTGKKARVIVGDGSAATYEDLVADGVVELVDYTIRDYPTTTLQQLLDGYWPADPLDPFSPMVAPMTADKKRIDYEKLAATYAVQVNEGVSVAGLYILGDKKGGLAYRSARGEKLGQDSPIRYVDGEVDQLGNPKDPNALIFGGNPLSHFNIAQKRLLGIIDRGKALPYEYNVWTAHERSAEDRLSKETVIGPEAAGGALTANLQRHFDDTLHMTTAEKRAKEKDDFTGKMVDDNDVEFRLYTRDHYSPMGNVMVKYKAVTRNVPAGDGADGLSMPLYIVAAKPGDGIEEFYMRKKVYALKMRELRAKVAA